MKSVWLWNPYVFVLEVFFVGDLFWARCFLVLVDQECTQGGHIGKDLGYRCNVGVTFKIMEKGVHKCKIILPKCLIFCHTLLEHSLGISEWQTKHYFLFEWKGFCNANLKTVIAPSRLLSIFCQSRYMSTRPIPLSIAGWKAGWCADCQSWMWLPVSLNTSWLATALFPTKINV